MKAFFYTLVLSAVLVGCIVLINNFQKKRPPSSPGFLSPSSSIHNRQPIASRAPLGVAQLDESTLKNLGVLELLNTGTEFFEQWHVAEALAVLQEVTAQDSTNAKAYLKLAECYADPLLLSEDRVNSSLAKAAALMGKDSLASSAMKDLFLRGDYEAAGRKLKKLLRQDGDDQDALYMLAESYFKAGQYKAASSTIEDLLKKDESHGRARELMVSVLAASGELDAAEHLAKDLASLYPGEPYPYVMLSRVELLKGNIEDAVEFCNNALNLDERYCPAILLKGYIYSEQGKFEAARVSFEKLLLFDEPMLASVANDALAYVDFLSGNFDDGVEEMDEAVRLALTSGSKQRSYYYVYKLLNYLCELGQGDEAELVLKKWMDYFARIPLQLCKLRLDIFNGDLTGVKHVLEQIESKPNWRLWMRVLDVDYREMLALTYIKENKYQAAIDAFAGGSNDKGPVHSGYYFLGFAAFESGDAEKAFSYFEEMLRRRTSMTFPYQRSPVRYVQSLFYLAETNLAAGKAEQAEKYYINFLSHWKNAQWDLQATSRAREKLKSLQKQAG